MGVGDPSEYCFHGFLEAHRNYVIKNRNANTHNAELIIQETLQLISQESCANHALLQMELPSGQSVIKATSRLNKNDIKLILDNIQSERFSALRSRREILLTTCVPVTNSYSSPANNKQYTFYLPWIVEQESSSDDAEESRDIGVVLYLAGGERFREFNVELRTALDGLIALLNELITQLWWPSLVGGQPNLEPGQSSLEQGANSQMIGSSQGLSATLRQAAMVAPLDVNVLITGQSGTGKSLLAQQLHSQSRRRDQQFLEINCAALPESLLENELFGAIAGGHSSAIKPVKGKLLAANGGTLFLDEVAELPPLAQAKLLQFLQSGEYYPLGASVPVKSDIRILCATNADLEDAVSNKLFRQDLYYRIKTFPIHMPALADRAEDIPQLAQYFCREVCATHGFKPLILTRSSLLYLQQMDWPGNVRELHHAIETACIRAECYQSATVEPVHLATEGRGDRLGLHCSTQSRAVVETTSIDKSIERGVRGQSFVEATRLFQADFLKNKLEAMNWNVSQTAKSLDMSRSHIHSLINSFELERQRKLIRSTKKVIKKQVVR